MVHSAALSAVAMCASAAALAQVDARGAFDYSVAIALPPGVGALQPDLALSYDSQAGDGLIGVGWELQGLPAIARMNYGAGINYDAGDTFVGPGGRLVNFNGTNVYHTQEESWVKYVPYNLDGSVWIGSGGCGNGPCYWRATEPDGDVLEFGTTADSRIEAVGRQGAVREWAVARVTDTAGNFYSAGYFEDGGSGDYRPASVTYNQGNGRSKLYSVEFSYEPRNDHAVEFSSGAQVDRDRRLRWIVVTTNGGQLIRKYRLDYEYGPTSGASLLKAVQEYGSDGTSVLPAHTFGWQEGNRSWSALVGRPGWGPNNGFANAGKYPLFIGDWNGDGRTDIGRVHNTGATFQISTASGWAPYADDWDGAPDRGFTDANRYPVLIGDWNGDGKTDFGRVNNAGAYFRISTGSGWQGYADRLSWGPNDGFTDGTTYPILTGDWNGDGKTDIARVHNWGIHFDVSTGTGWQPYAAGPNWSPSTGFSNANRYPILTGDWNGDGKTDIARVHNGGVAIALSTGSGWRETAGISGWGPNDGFVDGNTYPLLTGDWNGDGKTDLARVHHWGIHFVVATGTGWNAYAAGPNWSPSQGYSNANDYPVFTGDWDGDGKTDIGRVHNNGVVFQTSTGQGWRDFAAWPHWGKNEGYVDGNLYPTLTGDWSGEGKTGLGRVDNAGINFITRAGALPDLLSSVTNPLGGVTAVTYQPATWVPDAVRSDIASCEGAGSQPSICGNADASARPLVTRITSQDGRGNSYSKRYEYYNARYYPGAPAVAENLGFQRLSVVDEQVGTRETTTYRQDRPFHGQPSSVELFDPNGRLLSGTDWDYRVVDAPAATQLIRPFEEARAQYESGNFQYRTLTVYRHDAYGNAIRVSRLNDDATAADDVHTLTSYINDTIQWRIGIPVEVSDCVGNYSDSAETRRQSGGTFACTQVLRRAQSFYDGLALGQSGSRGDLTSSFAWRSDTDEWLQTRNTYDSSGSLLTLTNPAGVVAERRTYDSASGALAQVRDAAGNATSYEYDSVSGQLTASTDANGNTTRFAYDVFGRRSRTEIPHDGSTYSVVEESWSFNPNLNIITTAGERGPLVTTHYLDGLGRAWKTTQTWDSGTLLETNTWFDRAGREYRACAPHLSTSPVDESSCTTRSFDAAGRVVRVESPRSGGGFVAATTEYAGYRTSVTDAAGNVTVSNYDPTTLTSTLTQPGSLLTSTQKDVLGRVLRVTDPAGNVATYGYNSLGWKLGETDPVTGNRTFAYDVLGQLTSQTDATGQTTRFYYDAAGRLLRRDYPPLDAATAGREDVLFKYDYFWSPGDIANGKGRLVSMRDRSGGTLFAIDPAGRVRATIKDVDGIQYGSSTTYDRLGHRTSITYPDGSVVNYRYDTDAGHLSSITLNGTQVMRYADYTPRGAPASLSYGNHIEDVSLTFESATGELLQQQDSRGYLNNFYAYDERGMLTGERDLRSNKPNGDTSKAFAYDALGQLTSAAMGLGAACSTAGCSGQTWSRRYVYDQVGRVLEKDGKTFVYDAAKRFQLLRVSGEAADRTYDALGRLSSKAAGTNVDSYVNGTDGFLQEHRRDGNTLHRMTYDYLGNRVKKEFLGANPQTTWDLGGYKIVHDRNSGKYFHTLYVMGLNGARIAHRTVEKSGMAAATMWSAHPDRTTASLYEPQSRGGFLPWAKHSAAAAAKMLLNDLDGARGAPASLTALAILGALLALAVICARQLIARVRDYFRSVHRRHRRSAWLAPAALCALATACAGKYEPQTSLPTTAESIKKQGTYSLMQALTPGGMNQPVPGTFYYLNSPLGSTNVMFDALGAALLRLEYFPDGTVNTAASTGDYVATHTFGQKEFDKELDAYYNAVRYYDATTLRFTTPDAIKESGDFLVHNIYAYTRNNPVNYTDPSGFVTLRPQIDGPRGPVAAPRAAPPKAQPRYIPVRRPSNPVRTARFNGGPDGAAKLVARQTPRPAPALKVDSAAGAGGQKVPKNYTPPVHPPQAPPREAVPSADNDHIYDLPNGDRIRIGDPWSMQPDGYWKQERPSRNGGWQPVDPATGKPPGSMSKGEAGARVHVPLPHRPCTGCCDCAPDISVDPQDIAPIIAVGVGGVGAAILIGAGGGMRLRF